MKIIQGDLIALAKAGEFDVIAHGCNCFCTQASGIAYQMVKAFGTDDVERYPLEKRAHSGDPNKLGQIQGAVHKTPDGSRWFHVLNCYTQFNFGTDKIQVNYTALRLCMHKINMVYGGCGFTVGLPKIGCGLAGGSWNVVKSIFEEELVDCNVVVVEFE